MWTDYLANKMLDHIFSDPPYTPPTTLYVGLSTTTPNPDGSNFTEPAGGGYARATATAAQYSAAAGRSKTNSAEIAWPEPTGPWGTGTHYGFFDSITGGNLLIYTSCVPRLVSPADAPKIEAGSDVHEIV